ncbi:MULTISPECIES: phosphoribosylamine--glycine ligase [unclassified Helicobacter]|uniref:phosphoribosylamine--glycine ligase n=1 Tax=unclassified Helicobacter TaxID=2593540 RepID=UPI000CF056B6|nr:MULTISPECIES: phosphoribosylamine--glycine ligase [unclassified Helicobacter]
MSYRVLILGSGGREYAIGLHLLKDKRVEKIFFSPGNGGTSQIGENFSFDSHQDLIKKVKKLHIGLVIIGSEAFIIDGISDLLRQEGIKVFGPSKKAGMLEGSKSYMKDFAVRHHIPTARYIQTSDFNEAKEFLGTMKAPYVIKADGLCAGKGVVITSNKEEALDTIKSMLSGERFGQEGKCVVIEEFLEGFELSVFAICDGKDYVLLPACQDHKRLLDNDEGPNTGGMGAYSPAPQCDQELMDKIAKRIIQPTVEGLKEEGNEFEGVLFAGIMVKEFGEAREPFLLEYNVRFGDPECQVLMPLLKTSLIDICESVIRGKLKETKIEFYNGSAMAVVLASKDYPYANSKAQEIKISSFDNSLGHIVFAGVTRDDKMLFASGGRVLLSVGLGEDLKQARNHAYKIIDSISFSGMQYRKDIGHRAL